MTLAFFFVFRRNGFSAGVITTHIDDLPGRGEQDILQKMGKFLSSRFGPVKAQQDNFTHMGVEVLQKKDGSAEVTQKTFSDLLCPIATSASLWRDRNRPLNDEEPQICRSKLGELFWLATVSRQDICARLARFSANPNGLEVIDIYCINDLTKTVKKWQSGCTLKYPAGLPKPARRSLSCRMLDGLSPDQFMRIR